MTSGQIAKLQELSRCYGATRRDRGFIRYWSRMINIVPREELLSHYMIEPNLLPFFKADLRRLWHLYRHQVKAMRRNREL